MKSGSAVSHVSITNGITTFSTGQYVAVGIVVALQDAKSDGSTTVALAADANA